MYDTTKPYTKQILELIKQTWETPYVSVKKEIIEKKFSHPETSSSDGIGTKGVYHWQQRSFRNAVLDGLGMNLNDLLLLRARPYKLQNHIFVPKEDGGAILEIIKSLSKECKERDIAVTGGETSVHYNMHGLEISMTVDGFIKNPKPNTFVNGDVLIGLKSNGLHSNGFTRVREIFEEEFRSEFIEPTKIYLEEILALDERFDIHGMMHITGGAYTKLKGLLPDTNAIIDFRDLKANDIFYELYERGVSDKEMYKTFNCGIGFVLSTSRKDSEKILSESNNLGLESSIIGEITSGTGSVKIKSMFSKNEVIL
ncbi:MAG TPA: hypothetical protein ENG87_04145 [Candidatus Pacearchaeota archaeon]|nr:phosphoribosylformylglycinamidine cyclo-ligase [archaeon BMS3Abin17]HDK42545.1 hypothetical protein [Candidatus Pacearchaeota archaeon]HDZ60819.1 hypothetical protein [Candidatus Pacearchaeota archaeon]